MKKRIRLSAILLAVTVSMVPAIGVYAEGLEQLNNEDYGDIVSLIKEQIANGSLESEEDIEKAIEAAEDNLGIEISDRDKEKAVKILDTVNDLGIDKEKLVDVVDDVYDKVIDGKEYKSVDEMVDAIEDQVIDSATDKVKEVVKENVKNSFSDYISTFIERINAFIDRILGLWRK